MSIFITKVRAWFQYIINYLSTAYDEYETSSPNVKTCYVFEDKYPCSYPAIVPNEKETSTMPLFRYIHLNLAQQLQTNNCDFYNLHDQWHKLPEVIQLTQMLPDLEVKHIKQHFFQCEKHYINVQKYLILPKTSTQPEQCIKAPPPGLIFGKLH